MPESKQFARTSTCTLLNPLMPYTGIFSPPRKFLVSTKLVRLGRYCEICNVNNKLVNPFPDTKRCDRDLKFLKLSGISPTNLF